MKVSEALSELGVLYEKGVLSKEFENGSDQIESESDHEKSDTGSDEGEGVPYKRVYTVKTSVPMMRSTSFLRKRKVHVSTGENENCVEARAAAHGQKTVPMDLRGRWFSQTSGCDPRRGAVVSAFERIVNVAVEQLRECIGTVLGFVSVGWSRAASHPRLWLLRRCLYGARSVMYDGNVALRSTSRIRRPIVPERLITPSLLFETVVWWAILPPCTCSVSKFSRIPSLAMPGNARLRF
ncbi:hypothetical protein BSKO_10683 [Bryopsis sp. KO-2023]|nr:hypothetical protein BSKO_10683 [Bryopsis sp. KO-2023]